jgi:hypothetical protein
MATSYELWLADPKGNRIAYLDTWDTLSWTRVKNGVGQFSLSFGFDQFSRDLWWGLDRRLEVWRQPEGGTLQLIRIFFLRYLRQQTRGDRRTIIIGGPDCNTLLDRRTIAYDAQTAEAFKTGTADDIMKEFVDENLGASATDSDRDWETPGYITIQPDLGNAASIEKGASWRPLLPVLQECADASTQLGTPAYFDMVETFSANRSVFEFRTFTGQRGQDRSWPNGINPVILSAEMGNLTNPDLMQDWRDEKTFVYVAGQGTEENRLVRERDDATRVASSVFGRIEGVNSRTDLKKTQTAAMDDSGDNWLRENRPRREFTATITDTPQFRYQRDWDFGDLLTGEYESERYTVEVRATRGQVRGTGEESIVGMLDYAE